MAADRYLRFDVSRPRGGRPLLWPVYVWKVIYPTKRILKLNLFQQAILGLSRARCQDSTEMAELLGLDRELVMFIVATQLIPNGWMTNLGALTPQGERVLEEARDATEDVHMGYAYQDAISGNWLPRFSEELPEIEAKHIDARGYPVFSRDRDSGKEDRPFRLNHLKAGVLDMGAVFEAFERYRLDHDRAKQQSDDLPTRVRSDSIGFVEDTAQLMWLWTWVFPDQAGSHPWLIADPFGLQPAASWLRKPLQELLPRNEGAARYVAKTMGEAQPTNLSAEAWLRSLENQIDLTLLADYSWSRKVPIVEGYLTSVLRKKASLEGQDRSWPEDITSLLIETHNLAESVLQWLLNAYPAEIKRLPHWKDRRDWKNGEAQQYLQFFKLPCLTDDVIRRLSEQRLDQVRAAAKRGNSPLKALLFASLLATIDQEKHPFLSLSADELKLGQLLDMADARNKKAGHSGIERVDKENAIQYANFAIEWIQIFKAWY